MRTFFDSETGKYRGNLADSRAAGDKTLPNHLAGCIAVEGDWNGHHWLNPATGTVEPDPDNPPPARRVSKLKIVDRLKAAGLLVAANAALNAGETPDAIELAERWYRPPDDVAVDDPRVLAFLAAIGAKPEEILAP